MSVSVGQEVYNHGKFPCSGVGIAWKSEELDEAVNGPVAAALFDESGKNSIREMVAGIPETEFERKALDDMLNDPQEVEDWRVGEAIAETYLTHHRSCEFPWPSARDKKSIGSSLPGADLAGFGTDGEGGCFAFGEVKTSSDGNYPPGVMYGRTGMKRQLENLRDKPSVRKDLVMYLAHRVRLCGSESRFRVAFGRYLKNPSDVQIYGVLIRDVRPDVRDPVLFT